jgi:hypothetical protein
VLLVGFGSKEGFEEPATVHDLMDLPNLLEGSDGLLHNRCFLRTIQYFLDGNQWKVPSVDHPFVIFDRDEDSIFVKHGPVFLDKIINTVAYMGYKVGQIKVAMHLLAVFGFVIGAKEEGIYLVKGRRWVHKFA